MSAAHTRDAGASIYPPSPREMVLVEASATPSLSVLVAGDLCVRAGTPLPADGEHPWAGLVDTVAGHDVAILNLECPLTVSTDTIAKLGPSLAGDPALAVVVRDGGFTAVTLANNHIMDRGWQGLGDTLAACRGAGLATVGAGADLAAATAPLMIVAGGVHLAVVDVAEREFSIATPVEAGAAPLDPWATLDLVHRLRGEADAVLVILHGGNEYYPVPRPGLKDACRALARAGASAIVCHHAHVPGPVEVVDGTPISYGLGNFLFPARTAQPEGWYRGYLLSLDITANGVSSLRLIPYDQGRGTVAVRGLSVDEEAAFLAVLGRLAGVTMDDRRLEASWLDFCRRRRPDVLAAVLGLTRVERRLLRAGVWPSWRLPRGRVAGLLDMVACDSHRETLETLVRVELEK